MRLTFLQLAAFREDWKKLKLTDEDLQELEKSLLPRPGAGRVIAGTGGLRKVRFAPPSWHVGKSGAVRVCYAWFSEVNAVYFFTAYTHQEKDNLLPADKAVFFRVLGAYGKWLRERFPDTGVLP